MIQRRRLRERRSATATSLLTLVAATLLLLISPATASASITSNINDASRSLNYNTDSIRSASDQTTNRILFGSFEQILAKTPVELSFREVDDIHAIMSEVIQSHVEEKLAVESSEARTTTQAELTYLFLGNMFVTFRNEQTTLSFPSGGVAAFASSNTASIPTVAQLNTWVREALETNLLPALHSTSQFRNIEYAAYLTDRTNNDTPSQVKRGDDSLNDENLGAGVIAGSTVAGAVLLVGVVALFVKQRQQLRKDDSIKPVPLENILSDEEELQHSPPRRPTEDRGEHPQVLAAPSRSIPHNASSGASIVSESSFTVTTEAGDSQAVKSLKSGTGPSTNRMLIPPTESFEKDVRRRVHLQKDMLTSTWIAPAAAGRAIQMESVLQPSHFTASGEVSLREALTYSDDENHMRETIPDVEEQGFDMEAYTYDLRFESAQEGNDATFLQSAVPVETTQLGSRFA